MTTTLIDRVVRWNLDFDGDIYGDERERLRWYEGIATAASLQWMALPWAAAVLVLVLGRPAVVPGLVMLAVLLIPQVICTVYVRRRRVDTTPRSWSRKQVLLSTLTGLPYAVFLIASLRAWDPDSDTWRGAIAGGLVGGAFGIVVSWRQVRRRQRREAQVVGDED